MNSRSKTTQKRKRKPTIAAEALLQALENERRYVARELHDGVAQTSLQLGLQVGICRKLLERGLLDMLAQELTALESRIQLTSIQVREIIADMRLPRLEPEASLLEFMQSVIKTHEERGGPPLELQVNLADQSLQFSLIQKQTLSRIVQEALLNIRKHAQAQNVRVSLGDDERNFYLIIADNGRGFDLGGVEAQPLDRKRAGLTNLQARTEALGGTLAITRDAIGGWTEVKVTLPLITL